MSTRSTLSAVVLLCAALTAGCNRGPAREALAEAEQAIEAGRPQLEAYAPQELAGLRSAAQDARALLDEGRYTEALRLAQGLPGRVQDALEKGNRRKSELEAEWAVLSGRLPLVLRGLGLKLDEVAAKPSRGLDPDALVAARERLVELDRSWSQAASAFAGGRSAPAVAAAREVAQGADALAARLGQTPDAAVARANAASAAAAGAASAAAAGPTPAPRP